MMRSIASAVGGCRAAAWALGLWFAALAHAAHAPVVGEHAPSFLGYGVDAKKVLLETYQGKVVVVSFWATWCPPCRRELPVLERIQVGGKGHIQVVAINTESREVFRRAAKAMKDFTLLLTSDEDGRGFNAYGAKGLPHLVVIGKDGLIISVREGYGPDELDGVAAELNAALRAGLPEDAAPKPEAPTP